MTVEEHSPLGEEGAIPGQPTVSPESVAQNASTTAELTCTSTEQVLTDHLMKNGSRISASAPVFEWRAEHEMELEHKASGIHVPVKSVDEQLCDLPADTRQAAETVARAVACTMRTDGWSVREVGTASGDIVYEAALRVLEAVLTLAGHADVQKDRPVSGMLDSAGSAVAEETLWILQEDSHSCNRFGTWLQEAAGPAHQEPVD